MGRWLIPNRRWLGWAATAVAALGVLGAGFGLWWRGRAERHLAAAELWLRDGQPEEALLWLPLPEADPATRNHACLLRARIGLESGRLMEAVRALDRVKNPQGAEVAEFAFWKGRTLFAAGQPLLATHWLHAALDHRPHDGETLRWLAAAAYDLGDRTTVVNSLEEAVRLDPRDARAWRTLGAVFKENADYERARSAYQATLRIDSSQPQVRLELAETLFQCGEPDAAERELELCRNRVAEGARADLLARCRKQRDDLEGWRAAVEDGLARAPEHPGLLTQRAQVDLVEGHAAAALKRLDRALRVDPYRAQTFFERGTALRMLGRIDEANRDFKRAADLNRKLAEMSELNEEAARAPDDAQVRYRLGELCVALGKHDLAASWYRAALACDPKHNAARLALDSLGRR